MKTFLLEKHPDETDSLLTVITLYDTLLLSFGLDEDDLGDHIDDHKSIKHHRYVICDIFSFVPILLLLNVD